MSGQTQTKNRLKDFLSYKKIEKGQSYTHTLIGGAGFTGGSFDIALDEREYLHELLAEAIFREGQHVCLTERPTENSPLRIDVDLRFDQTDESQEDLRHRYSDNDLSNLVDSYNQILKQYLDIDANHLLCYVMEREQAYIDPKNTKTIKDGIHLIYPNIILSRKNFQIIRSLILPLLRNRLDRLLVLTGMSIDQMIDAAIVENNWLMYGCGKPNIAPYLLTKILDDEGNDVKDQFPTRPIDLINVLRVNLEPNIEETPVKLEYEPLFNLYESNKLRKNAGGGGAAENTLIVDERVIKNRGTSIDVEDARKLTKLLNSARADDRNGWIRVGWCLRNISHDLIDEWIQFSRKSQKYEDGICEKEWSRSDKRSDGFNIGSLFYWAQEDNPEGFKEFNNQRIDNWIKKAGSCTHQDVAHLIYRIYKGQFVSTDAGAKKTDKIWYKFENHRWSECDGKIQMKTIMGMNLPDFCYMTKIRILERRRVTEDEEEKNHLDKIEEDIQKLLTKLKDTTFKDKVYLETIYMFHDPDFFKKLDENIDFIGCENGVYNLRTGEFREGQPEDFVSLSTKINYITADEEGVYGEMHPKIQAINAFFRKIQPKASVCEYLQLLLGYCLYGRNILEQFYILEGVGGNGKSKLIELMELTLGPYAAGITSNYFTQKRANSGAANPEIAHIVHARLVTTQEMEETEKMNLAVFKSICGNDKMVYRPMYGASREVRPKFNILMAVNHLPALPPDDTGTWRRVRLIRFLSRFVDNPDPNSEYEHLKDSLLAEKFQVWREPMLYLLFEWHRKFRDGGCRLEEPLEVLEATREYQKQNDQYSEFIERYTVRKVGAYLQLDRLFDTLKAWWEQNASGSRPDKKQFKAILERRWQMRSQNSRDYGPGWPDRELCDGIDIIKTTDASGREQTLFELQWGDTACAAMGGAPNPLGERTSRHSLRRHGRCPNPLGERTSR